MKDYPIVWSKGDMEFNVGDQLPASRGHSPVSRFSHHESSPYAKAVLILGSPTKPWMYVGCALDMD